MKVNKAAARRDATAKWNDRTPWPCVILSVDPGAAAGASIIASGAGGLNLLLCEAVDIDTTRVEEIIEQAQHLANVRGLPLVAVLEDWGAGGPRGLSQWIGLGEARGPWRRWLRMRTNAKIVLARQGRWRSMVIPETGRTNAAGKWEPFGPDGWKDIAKTTAVDHFVEAYVPPLDAAESACMGVFAARSDVVGKVLTKTHLKRHGLTFEPLEPTIFGK